jgi:hypothetical protein
MHDGRGTAPGSSVLDGVLEDLAALARRALAWVGDAPHRRRRAITSRETPTQSPLQSPPPASTQLQASGQGASVTEAA